MSVVVEVNVRVLKWTFFFCRQFSKAEMELKRKQEEEDRKKRAGEEKAMQVWRYIPSLT